MEELIGLICPVALLLLGLVAGTISERTHFRSLKRREKESSAILVTNLKSYPGGSASEPKPTLVTGEAVIATDYLKTFLAGLRKIIGGEMRSYESLMIRARREALMRVIEQARELGHDAVCNVRYYSTDVGGGTRSKGAAMVEIYAVATAYTRKTG